MTRRASALDMTSFAHDIKYSLRSLAKQPVFSLVAVLSLALGIGINTAIFSALDALLLRPLAVRDLDRTVIVYDTNASEADAGTSFPTFQILHDRRETFSRVMATAGARPLSLIDGDRREQVFAELVTADFFSIADVTLHLGRPLDRDIDRVVDPPSVAVLSHAFWQRRFGSDPAIVGKTIVLNGQPFVATGVARQGFIGLDVEVSVDLWVPMTTWAHLMGESGRLTGDEHWIRTFASAAAWSDGRTGKGGRGRCGATRASGAGTTHASEAGTAALSWVGDRGARDWRRRVFGRPARARAGLRECDESSSGARGNASA